MAIATFEIPHLVSELLQFFYFIFNSIDKRWGGNIRVRRANTCPVFFSHHLDLTRRCEKRCCSHHVPLRLALPRMRLVSFAYLPTYPKPSPHSRNLVQQKNALHRKSSRVELELECSL